MAEPILSCRGLTKRFGGLLAVNRVDLDVEQGEILGLIGPNGAGKSTLFRLIAGIMHPNAGTVTFGGHRITNRPAHDVCVAGVAATHQIVRPFLAALRFCGLEGRAHSDARTLNLSGQKRLEIARALATRPEVLLLDEVLAGLNPTETDQTLELVRTIRSHGTTIVMVEHNLRAVRGVCSRIVALVNGSKIAEGSPEAVLNDEAVVSAYLGTTHA